MPQPEDFSAREKNDYEQSDASDLRQALHRLERAANWDEAITARREATHTIADWGLEVPDEQRGAVDAAIAATCRYADRLLDNGEYTQAAWRIDELANAVEYLNGEPVADHGQVAAPEHYQTTGQRLLFLLASADEVSGFRLMGKWRDDFHKQQTGPGHYPGATILAAPLEAALNLPGNDPGVDRIAATLSRSLHHALGAPAPEWNEPCCPVEPVSFRGIVSLDIDDTIDLQDGYPGAITWAEVAELQQAGYLVGTCSDREPSDQRYEWRRAGLSEGFAIPKELMHGLKTLFPDLPAWHIGDSPERDRDEAFKQRMDFFVWHSDFNVTDFTG